MAIQLESGNYLLSPEEAVACGPAAEFLYRRMGLAIALDAPLTADDWLLLLAARQCFEGQAEVVDGLIAQIEHHLQRRRQRH